MWPFHPSPTVVTHRMENTHGVWQRGNQVSAERKQQFTWEERVDSWVNEDTVQKLN